MGKTPIWMMSKRNQLSRVLRYSEAKEIISKIDIDGEDEDGWTLHPADEITRADVQLWLQALLFSGMRLFELHKLHANPSYLDGKGNLVNRFQDDGSILLDKNLFYDTGKKKQTAVERYVYLSDMGIPIMERFFKASPIHHNPRIAASILDSVLKVTSRELGYETRKVSVTYKRRNPTGQGKITVESEKYTTGVMVRSFRKTWNSWLINSYKDRPDMLVLVEKSMGHTQQIAMTHYLTFQYDEEDMVDIRKATAGFGLHPGWRDKLKEKEGVKA